MLYSTKFEQYKLVQSQPGPGAAGQRLVRSLQTSCASLACSFSLTRSMPYLILCSETSYEPEIWEVRRIRNTAPTQINSHAPRKHPNNPKESLYDKISAEQSAGRSRTGRAAHGKAPSRDYVSTPHTVTPESDQGATPSGEALRWGNVLDGLPLFATSQGL